MKTPLYIYFIATLFIANVTIAQSQNQLLLSPPEVEMLGGSAVVEMKFENTFDQPIKAIRAMIVLMAEDGTVVGTQSQWLGGQKTQQGLKMESGKTAEYPVKIKTEKPATKANVFVTRIILEDGSKPNPHKAFSLKESEAKK